MRIFHFADLHLGVESYGRLDPETGLNSRLIDFLAALDHLVEGALEEQVDLVLFCGDAYKSRDPSQTEQREFAKRIARLARAGTAVYLLVGNHDLPNAIGRASTVDIFDALGVPNVYVGARPEVQRIETRSGPVQVAALPWLRRGALIARQEADGGGRRLTLDELKHSAEEILTDHLCQQAASLDPAVPAVLAAHVFVEGSKRGSERHMMAADDPMILKSSIGDPTFTGVPAFDYAALGHIHTHQELQGRVPMVYSGGLCPIDFSEEEQEKGFVCVELDPEQPSGHRVVSHQFRPVPTRRFVTVEAKPGPDDDPTGAALRAIGRHDVGDAIVRLRIHMTPQQEPLLREPELRQALSEAHYVAAISREVKREVRTRLPGGQAESLTPLEALEEYLSQKKTPQRRRKRLAEAARALLQQNAE